MCKVFSQRVLVLVLGIALMAGLGSLNQLTHSASLSSVSATLSNSRPSFRGALSSGNTEGTSQVLINTTAGAYPSTSAAQLVEGDYVSIGNGGGMGTYRVTDVLDDGSFTIDGVLGSGQADTGDDVISTQSSNLAVRFTTTNAVQDGAFRVLVPANSDLTTSSDGVPDGGEFDVPEFDSDSFALFAAMSSQPNNDRKVLIDQTIRSLKDKGVWGQLDFLHVYAAHDSQAALVDWKQNHDGTAVNAPTFNVDQGFAGNGTSSYLNTSFVPLTDGVRYTLNDASFGVYSRTNIADVNMVDFGGWDGLSRNRIIIHTNLNRYYFNVNQASTGDAVSSGSSSEGFFSTNRVSSSIIQGYKNGSQMLPSKNNSSNGLPNIEQYVGAMNNNGTPGGFSARQYSLSFAGAAMSAQQHLDFYNIMQSYLTEIGSEVGTPADTLVGPNGVTCPSSLSSYTFSPGEFDPASVVIDGQTYHSFVCPYTGTGAVGTAFDGTSNDPMVIHGLINPAPTAGHTVGTADTYPVIVQHLDSSNNVVDQTSTQIGLIEAVKVTASVEPLITFRIMGVNSGESRCDQQTTVSTSPTEVSFGSLLIDQFRYAAQSLAVSTNAAGGYAVTALANDQMGRNGGTCTGDPGNTDPTNTDCIPDATAPNISHTNPATWSSANQKGLGYSLHDLNTSGATPAFQYNTSSGSCAGSECYKQFADREDSELPQTIFSATTPADNHNIDICYKAIISPTQAAGSYENYVTYTATARF